MLITDREAKVVFLLMFVCPRGRGVYISVGAVFHHVPGQCDGEGCLCEQGAWKRGMWRENLVDGDIHPPPLANHYPSGMHSCST